MTEQKFWQWLRPQFSRHCHLMRVENIVGVGASDVNGCRFGVEAWIELKIFHGNKITLQPTQPPWITKRTAHGGRVWIVAAKETTTSNWGFEIYLYNSSVLPLLLKCGVACIDGVKSPKADAESIKKLATLVLTGTKGSSTFDLLEETIFRA